jgi:hypothetical protein
LYFFVSVFEILFSHIMDLELPEYPAYTNWTVKITTNSNKSIGRWEETRRREGRKTGRREDVKWEGRQGKREGKVGRWEGGKTGKFRTQLF